MQEQARGAEATIADRADDEEGFRKHLVSFLTFALFFFALNALTSWGDWWFYWPVFFWGFALISHAVAVYGPTSAPRIRGDRRASRSGEAAAGRRGAPPAASAAEERGDAGVGAAQSVSTELIDEAEARVAGLWRSARRLPAGPAREQAFQVAAAADRVAEVMAADRTDGETVRWFVDRLLVPTEQLLDRYGRLTQRGVAGAEPMLAKVETEDLPRIEARLDALYQQLHRGDVVDLAVTSEMLEFGLDDPPPVRKRLG